MTRWGHTARNGGALGRNADPIRHAWDGYPAKRKGAPVHAIPGYCDELAGIPLPFGAIVCTVTVTGCLPVEWHLANPEFTEREQSYGDYDAGRFGWMLADVEPVDPPVAIRGRQGVFEVPDPPWRGDVVELDTLRLAP